MGVLVIFPQLSKKALHRPLESAQILLVVRPVLIQTLLMRFSRNRVSPCRIIKGPGIVRPQIHDHRVRLPGRKFMFPKSTQRFVPGPCQKSADLLVVSRNHVSGVVVPTGEHAPAALGDHAVFRVQRLRGHVRVIVHGAEPHRNPVLLRPGPDRSLAGCNAVADKLDLDRLVFHRRKGPVELHRVNP
ncbi:hypothetical protein D1872_235560 [compost metagenome]